MKNKKAFTLVELLVAMVILGIITGISFPLLRRVQEANKLRKYISYEDSMKYSAKLYVNSYQEDLFGEERIGCYVIPYESMEEKDLLKDISLDDTSCKGDNTFVKVTKVDDTYGYFVHLECMNTKTEGVEYESNKDITSTCQPDDKVNMIIAANPMKSTSYSFKPKQVKVTISSVTGIDRENIKLQYIFSTDKNGENVIGNWNTLSFTEIPTEEQQKEVILSEGEVKISSKAVTTPEGVTGDLYLVVKVETLRNLELKNWTEEEGQTKIFGPYMVNVPNPATPTISGGTTKIYNYEATTLTCATTTTYGSGITKYYSFGYATTDGGTPGNWTTPSTSATYTIPKDAYLGTRYYSCRVYVSDGTSTSSTVTSSTTSDTAMSLVNARIYFDTNGGQIYAQSNPYSPNNLYVRYGKTNFYLTRTATVVGGIPYVIRDYTYSDSWDYTFNGWYTAPSGGTQVIAASGVVQANVSGWTNASKQWIRTATGDDNTSNVLYAHWTLTYNPPQQSSGCQTHFWADSNGNSGVKEVCENNNNNNNNDNDDDGGSSGGGCANPGGCCACSCGCVGCIGCSGTHGCFLAGTKVMTIFGLRDIDKIKSGDLVLTFNDETGKNEYKRVIEPITHINFIEDWYTLTMDDNSNLRVTQEHKFYIKNEKGIDWVRARELKVGDYVKYADGTFHQIVDLSYASEIHTEYNLEVEDNHNYYVGSQQILVHNLK